jgi:hypothetical protein
MKSLRYYQVRLEECAADIAQPINHLGGTGEQRRRHVKAEGRRFRCIPSLR